jgi:hypothetical protein
VSERERLILRGVSLMWDAYHRIKPAAVRRFMEARGYHDVTTAEIMVVLHAFVKDLTRAPTCRCGDTVPGGRPPWT